MPELPEPVSFEEQLAHMREQLAQMTAATLAAQTAAAQAQQAAAASAAQAQQAIAVREAASTSQRTPYPPKPPKPDTFDGKRGSNIETWAHQVAAYFAAAKITDPEMQYHYAVTLLRGDAATWVRAHDAHAARQHTPALERFADLVDGLRRQFKPVNADRVARDQLSRLRQDRSVQEYVARFRNICLEIPDLSDSEQLDRFIRGLKPAAQRELELHRPDSFDVAVEVAERVDAVEWRLRHHGTTSSPYVTDSYRQRYNQGPVPMELGSVRKTTPITDVERKKILENNGCFYCRELNVTHRAANCPKKQANANSRKAGRPGNGRPL